MVIMKIVVNVREKTRSRPFSGGMRGLSVIQERWTGTDLKADSQSSTSPETKEAGHRTDGSHWYKTPLGEKLPTSLPSSGLGMHSATVRNFGERESVIVNITLEAQLYHCFMSQWFVSLYDPNTCLAFQLFSGVLAGRRGSMPTWQPNEAHYLRPIQINCSDEYI